MNDHIGSATGAPPFARRTSTVIGGIIAVGVLLMASILLTERRTPAAEGEAESGLLNYPRGPHGARLVSDGPLQLEMTIYETGVEPQFRVYPYDADLKPIAPSEVTLAVELHRLGGRLDRIGFRSEADYLLGEAVVQEPHSFDVVVVGVLAGQRHEWKYSQIEGKVTLGDEQLRSAGIEIAIVGPRVMLTTIELPGEVRANGTRLAHVVPRLKEIGRASCRERVCLAV